ncbi:unnamed protein product [Ambrosiozyma monospora]|uniref:Unnamed protein product n=1 Tax=Ambrosiozyma monospora TaxID=43982 RepID=A0A9W6YTG8_AMBMO|nr:unnamed protein product [Ambrosiozyma monospora]
MTNNLFKSKIFLGDNDPYPIRTVSMEDKVVDNMTLPSVIVGRAALKGNKEERFEAIDSFHYDDGSISAKHLNLYFTEVVESHSSSSTGGFSSDINQEIARQIPQDKNHFAVFARDVSQHGVMILRHQSIKARPMKKGKLNYLLNGDIIGLVILEGSSQKRQSGCFDIFRDTKLQFQVSTDYKKKFTLIRLNTKSYLSIDVKLASRAESMGKLASESKDYFGGGFYCPAASDDDRYVSKVGDTSESGNLGSTKVPSGNIGKTSIQTDLSYPKRLWLYTPCAIDFNNIVFRSNFDSDGKYSYLLEPCIKLFRNIDSEPFLNEMYSLLDFFVAEERLPDDNAPVSLIKGPYHIKSLCLPENTTIDLTDDTITHNPLTVVVDDLEEQGMSSTAPIVLEEAAIVIDDHEEVRVEENISETKKVEDDDAKKSSAKENEPLAENIPIIDSNCLILTDSHVSGQEPISSNNSDAEDEGCCFDDAKRDIDSQLVSSQDDDGEPLSDEKSDLTYAADIDENMDSQSEQGTVSDDDSDLESIDECDLELVGKRLSELYKDEDYNGQGEDYLIGIIQGSINKYNHTFYDAVQKVLDSNQSCNAHKYSASNNTALQLEKEDAHGYISEEEGVTTENITCNSTSAYSKKRKFTHLGCNNDTPFNNGVSSSDECDDLNNSEYSGSSDDCTSLRTSEPPASPNVDSGSLDHVSKKSKLMSEEEIKLLEEKVKVASEEATSWHNKWSSTFRDLEKSEANLKAVKLELEEVTDELVGEMEIMSKEHVEHCDELEATYKMQLQEKDANLRNITSDVAHYKTMFGETKARLASCNSALINSKQALTQVKTELDTANQDLHNTRALYVVRTKELTDMKKKLDIPHRKAKGYNFKSVALGCLVGSIGTIGALLKLSSHLPDEI